MELHPHQIGHKGLKTHSRHSMIEFNKAWDGPTRIDEKIKELEKKGYDYYIETKITWYKPKL